MSDSDSRHPDLNGSDSLPDAVVEKRRGFSIVWLIPLVAALVGAWLAYKTLERTRTDHYSHLPGRHGFGRRQDQNQIQGPWMSAWSKLSDSVQICPRSS